MKYSHSSIDPYHKNVAQTYSIDRSCFFATLVQLHLLARNPAENDSATFFIYIWNEIGIGRELIMADIWILVLFECFLSERSKRPSHDAHIVHIKHTPNLVQSSLIFTLKVLKKQKKIKCK